MTFLIKAVLYSHLHPTMYLLIRTPVGSLKKACLHLHPTMYLLILYNLTSIIPLMKHLHPTMYLLIR